MPWQAGAPHGGFTKGEPWLPMSAVNIARAVDAQEGDARSLLSLTRSLLALRRNTPALRLGRLENIVADKALLAFDRIHAGERMRCLFNLSVGAVTPPSPPPGAEVILSVGEASPQAMPPYSAMFLRL